MMSNNNETPQGKGLGSGRWHWGAVKQAKTHDEVMAALAEVGF